MFDQKSEFTNSKLKTKNSKLSSQMSVEIRVPPLGESVVEATVGQWTKSEGDSVRKDEILVELETDKITVEVAAPQDGVLGRIEQQEGATVGVNDLLGSLNPAAATQAAA